LNRVLVLMGGSSEEREISLQSGANVCAALEKKGYQVESLDLNKDTLNQLVDIAPDVVFIALHGKNGEMARFRVILIY
jgi:D-alanine-D-alanine ligase